MPTLFREGGNLLAIAARAQGAPSRLIGLTWIDEAQSIIVRPDSGISRPAQLKGKTEADAVARVGARARFLVAAVKAAGFKYEDCF